MLDMIVSSPIHVAYRVSSPIHVAYRFSACIIIEACIYEG